MIPEALCLARKDVTLLVGRGSGLAQSFLLGLLLIFIFSLARGIGEDFSAQAASAVFWMATAFCQVLTFNSLYSLEEDNGQREALLLLPAPAQHIWLGKALAGMFLLLAAQFLFAPAAMIFLDQSVRGDMLLGLALLLLADLGLAAAGSLTGALAQGQAARESLLSIIIFPLLIPLLFSAISLGAGVLSGRAEETEGWIGILAAFDALFLAAGLALFGFIYGAQE
ncbi:MAG: heme exporter protein CcmB [Deltaproteobacteria bacterium]|jgi:heme exporter protein B|nr:heme exporter protein CcmB [Deltaproteobacteria bacterium]